MKLFGWGKSKDPQPPLLQQVKKSDPFARSCNGRDRGTAGMGSFMPLKGNSTGVRKQQGLFDVEQEDYLLGCATTKPKVSNIDDPDSDKKIEDTLQFVFSHEREGLLAIGTFALEQLQSIRNIIDAHQKSGDHDGYEAPNGASAMDSDMMQSSDDEDQLQRSWLAARKTCDLPVFGDVESSRIESEPERAPTEGRYASPNQSKALTLYDNGNRTSNVAVKPIVLLTSLPPELRRILDPASALLYGRSQLPDLVPHWTDSVPPPVVAKVEGRSLDEVYYSSHLCGLLNFRKKPQKSDRTLAKRSNAREIVPTPGEEKKWMIPIERAEDELAKTSFMKTLGSAGLPSLGKLAKLWRATCKQSSARIAPERKPCPQQASKDPLDIPNEEVFTSPIVKPSSRSGQLSKGAWSLKVEEFRRRAQRHERMVNTSIAECSPSRDGSGHWIKTDEDFVVLEM
ncbi:uncharacterized protein [Physcomitrium patens]|uniref:Uncharacterized protein n=1 Tax=Physcomitrium patens TaxID=3218 RepID=A0A2K1IP93_PHYPA|nr:uncharacterized protein LOC112274691 isoform X2 [Physcomitrium patens]PNR31099.1 hypothetical protein PHYPA_027415 [Physcomitrium patens]|eukprot:XP_024360138.1 uncharacterized protein LOC112274691 isoform X2 [Physcomitrella patens]